MKKKIVRFVVLILVSIEMTYLLPEIFATIFYICTLIAYYRSNDESFWLAYYLVLVDGFFGFFGPFEASLTAIPGLPAVEVTQIYILLTVVKARMSSPTGRPFYQLHLSILGIYLLFLIVQGQVIGLSSALNVQFRVFKYVVPLLAFYSIPRLIDNMRSYYECFVYFFLVALVAFATQIFTIFSFQAPPLYFGLIDPINAFEVEVSNQNTYRGFFNTGIVLISLFGAIFYLAKHSREFPAFICYLIIVADFLTAFLSATRGWILSFFLVIFSSLFFIERVQIKKIIPFTLISLLVFTLILSVPIIQTQIDNSVERLLTLKALKDGDTTADGTLLRITMRGPRVMKKWAESALTGWGFSDEFFTYNDGHVGNQNILMHSGVIGMFLLALFFLYFIAKTIRLSSRLPSDHPNKKPLLVFTFFFLGWYFLHSTSGQQFGYYALPGNGIIQALFFSMAAKVYEMSLASKKEYFPNTKEDHQKVQVKEEFLS